MPTKPKLPQKETPNVTQERDFFQTPRYGTKLIIPFLKQLEHRLNLSKKLTIWECASGDGRMSKVLEEAGFNVISTDLLTGFNFLTDTPSFDFDVTVTNVPFSLKKKFYQRAKIYEKPLSFLMPADYSAWVIDAIKDDGAEKIIPTSRINYITPNTIELVWRLMVMEVIWINTEEKFISWKKLQEERPEYIEEFGSVIQRYEKIDDIPAKLLFRASTSQFHSMWFLHGFNLGRTETFVELTNKMKLEIL